MKRILIADDKASSRELVRTVLEHCGYEVIEAADGAEALDKARESHPHLIMLDVQMPALDGFGVIEQLRNEVDFAATLFLALCSTPWMAIGRKHSPRASPAILREANPVWPACAAGRAFTGLTSIEWNCPLFQEPAGGIRRRHERNGEPTPPRCDGRRLHSRLGLERPRGGL